MAGVKPVSFVTPGFDYAADQAEIDRRRRLAELLQAQGMAPGGGTETVGGWAIKKSPLEGAGKVAQSYFGGLASKQADELSKQMRERQAGDFTSDRSALVAAMRGRPADQGVDDPTAGYAAPSAAQPPNPQAMEQLNFRSPMFQQLQMQQLAAQLQPPKYHVVGGSLVPEPRMGQQGQVAAAFTAPKMHALSPGQQLVPEPSPGVPGAAPAQVKPVYSAPDKDEAAKFNAILEGAGIPPDSPAGQQLFKALALKTATHQPAASTSVKVNSYLPASEEAQRDFIKSSRATYDQLKQAPVAIESIEQAKKLIPGAKGFMGPGGETLLNAAKFLNNRVGTNINTEGVKNAEELRTRIFFNIMDNLKKMDAQPSQQQQQIMQEALGKLGTDPGALPRVLDAFSNVMRDKVSLHNKEIKGAMDRGVKFPYDPLIQMPDPKGSGKTPSGPAPAGVDQKTWDHMTPEERKLFQ